MKTKRIIPAFALLSFIILSCSSTDCYQCKLPDNTFLDKMCADEYSYNDLLEARATCLAGGGTWYMNDKVAN